MVLPLLEIGEEQPDERPSTCPIIYMGRNFTRLIARRVNEETLAEDARRKAQDSGEWQVLCCHGGSVANAYKYPADTEAALAVASPAGFVVVWMARLPANKVTKSGAANTCLPGTRALFDPRYGEHSKDEVWARLKAAHREHFPQTAYERLLGSETF
jgi:hypothetical protein